MSLWSSRRHTVEELFGAYGTSAEGSGGSARDFFEALGLHRLVWTGMDRSFAQRSRPVVEWDSSSGVVVSWRNPTTGAVFRQMSIADLEFDGDQLTGFSVDSMPLPWMVRVFASDDSDLVAWAVVWQPGERMYFYVFDRAARPVEKALPARVTTRGVDEYRFATVETVFGQLVPASVLWHGAREKWWLRSFPSRVRSLGPLAVRRFVVPDLDGGAHEFVPVGPQGVWGDDVDVELDAHELALLMLTRVDDRRFELPGRDSACPWTSGMVFTFSFVDAGDDAVRAVQRLAKGWRQVTVEDRGGESSDVVIELRGTPSGFEVDFTGGDQRWNAVHIADLMSTVGGTLDAFAIRRVLIDVSD